MAKRRKAAPRSAPTAIVVRQAAPVRRRRASRAARAIVGHVRRRAKSVPKRDLMADALSVAGGAALGFARQRELVPERFGGLDAPLTIAAVAMAIPVLWRGKVARAVGDIGAGVGAVAAYRLVLGTKVWSSSGEAEWEDE